MKDTDPSSPSDPTLRVSEGQPRTYEPPAIVYESELEVRAGTPLGVPDLLDLTGTNK
jgi:hypothetical protein